MTEPTSTSSRKQRLQLILAALAAALAIGGVIVVAVDDGGGGESADEEVDGDSGGAPAETPRNPVREAREQGIPIINLTPKQAREVMGNPRKLQRLLQQKAK